MYPFVNSRYQIIILHVHNKPNCAGGLCSLQQECSTLSCEIHETHGVDLFPCFQSPSRFVIELKVACVQCKASMIYNCEYDSWVRSIDIDHIYITIPIRIFTGWTVGGVISCMFETYVDKCQWVANFPINSLNVNSYQASATRKALQLEILFII